MVPIKRSPLIGRDQQTDDSFLHVRLTGEFRVMKSSDEITFFFSEKIESSFRITYEFTRTKMTQHMKMSQPFVDLNQPETRF